MTDSALTDETPLRAPPPPAAPASRWTAGRISMVVAGALLALIALGFMVAGGYGVWLDTSQRSGGYVMTSSQRFSTDGYALATRTLHVSSHVPSFLYGRDWLGNVRIRGESADQSRPLFIGIARSDAVDRYLAAVAHTDVTDINGGPFSTNYRPTYRDVTGGRPLIAPARAGFWVAKAYGPGSQSLTWSVRQGRWAVVVMRPDGSRGVTANLAAGAQLPALLWVSIVLLVVGLVIAAGGAALIYFALREVRRSGRAGATAGPVQA